jgi:hypothetical protein
MAEADGQIVEASAKRFAAECIEVKAPGRALLDCDVDPVHFTSASGAFRHSPRRPECRKSADSVEKVGC